MMTLIIIFWIVLCVGFISGLWVGGKLNHEEDYLEGRRKTKRPMAIDRRSDDEQQSS